MFSRLRSSARRRRASDAPIVHRPVRRRDRKLERLIAGEAIEVLFQPQFSVADGRVVGAEALARGSGSADQLFSGAAECGLSERLSRVIQRQALRSAAKWTGPLSILNLSINVLAEDIGRDRYDDWLLGEAQAAGISTERITVEITESALIKDAEAVSKRLERLRDAGVSVAIDDFGTGYASLAYLSALPLDLIKIDRSLIADIAVSDRAQIVVRAMIKLAHDLGLDVLVEGVEHDTQLRLLKAWGCHYYQGFLGAGALPQAVLRHLVEEAERRAA